MIDFLKPLVEAWGPSGYEHQVRALIAEMAAPYADEITTDPLGNLICRVAGQGGGGAPKVMIATHMDEIGVMALYTEKTSGYLRFTAIGGLMQTSLLGGRVYFEDGTLGVVAMTDYFTTHRMTAPDVDQFYIDVSQGGETANTVAAGSPAAFWRPMEQRGSRIIAKSLDNRAGCTVALEAMRRLNKVTPNEVFFVFTVQEEVGIRGAQTAAYAIEPDVAIAIDVTKTGDTLDSGRMEVRLGGGAAIKLHDSGLVTPPAIRDWMVNRAEADGIPYQLELLTLGTTDAAQIQKSRAGVPSGAISIPCRYVHTTSETVDMHDLEACVKLVTGLISHPVSLG